MSANWDYAQFTKTASEHGGPREYLDLAKGVAKGEGRAQGALAIATLTAACVVGSKLHGYMQKRKQLAAEAERELLEGMSEALPITEPGEDERSDQEGS